MTEKKTVILGASTHPWRYAYLAATKLTGHGYEIVPIGNKEGIVANEDIVIGQPDINNVHTVTMYLRPIHQAEYYEYILETLQPKRIVFNPGSENPELAAMAEKKDIEALEACTLVMLSTGQY
ncbi:MAG: CoA-binding protein [Chitinophagales bacterium]